ncbi:hypothetical protein GF339_10525 [candidate division KSB3 bacterium]|uniref:DUF1468 domain-containing protein n=1 Tax=candidate division KSB3 bacterium TaxID=2044937 RepID=A0A9D5JVT3_9BACT|nr:hypothetical protein [candidate division KSB3 bacterium]MBD3325010.1 hypothetical protein [candidate division KSB3 bacterium]
MDSKLSSYKADMILAVVLLAGSLYVFWESLSLPDSPYEPMGPAFVPQALCILIGFLAIVVFVQGIRKWQGAMEQSPAAAETEPSETDDVVKHPWLAILAVLLMFAYIGSMHLKLLGFRTATIIFILLLGVSLVSYEKEKVVVLHLIILLILAGIMGLGGYYLFTQVFYVNLP